MDMYQKREMRKNKKMNKNKTNINCLSLIYLTPFTNPYNTKGF